MNRRQFLKFLTLTAGTSVLPARANNQISLREIANPKGIDIGSIYSHRFSKDEKALVKKHCNILTPENAFKPHWLYSNINNSPKWRTDAACYKNRSSEAICDKQLNKMKEFALSINPNFNIHGHAVYWAKYQIPVIKNPTHETFQRAWQNHINNLVKLIPDAVSWDVINEPFSKDWKLLKKDLLTALAPDSYLGKDIKLLNHYVTCIKTLKSALSKKEQPALLMLNESGLHGYKKGHSDKRRQVLKLLKELKSKGAKLDGVGLQCHINSGSGTDAKATAKFIRDLENAGYVSHISELDYIVTENKKNSAISYKNVNDEHTHNEELQARIIGNFLDVVLQEKGLKKISFWGLSDENHWLNRNSKSNKLKHHPGIFSKNQKPKLVFHRIVKALKSAPSR